MAVDWNDEQQQAVELILAEHPISSGRCEQCACKIREVGSAIDPKAHCMSIRPAGREPFVAPKANLSGARWHYHFTTNVCSHFVDILTSAPGTASSDYLSQHWHHPDALRVTVEEPSDD